MVSTFGSSLSPKQEELISNFLGPAGQVVTLYDADESGRQCSEDCVKRLSSKLYIKAINIEELGVKKPHQLSKEQAKTLTEQL